MFKSSVVMFKAVCQPLAIFSMTLFVLVGISGCSDDSTSKKLSKKAEPKPIVVELSKPIVADATAFYETTSTLEPSADIQINARASGVVKRIQCEEGDDVRKGDILLVLEDDDQRLRLKQAQQSLDSSKREYDRLNKMRTAGAVSAKDWESASNEYLKAKTEVELAELTLSYTQIAAPFDGRIVSREIDAGDFVASGALVFRMMSIKPLLVKVHVPANRIGKVAKGQSIQLGIDSLSQPLNGKIDLVSPIVDPKTGTIKVTVKLEDYPRGVRPGDFVAVKMITDTKVNATLVPSITLIEERGLYHLFVVDGDKAIRKKVQVGYILDDKTEIISGLEPTEKIVIKGQRSLNDGDSVTVFGSVTDSSGDETSTTKAVN